jgi:hypothetical protein
MNIELYQGSVELDRMNIEPYQESVELDRMNIEPYQESVELYQESVEKASGAYRSSLPYKRLLISNFQ